MSMKHWSRALCLVALATPGVVQHGQAQSVDVALFRMKQDSVTLVLGALEVQRPLGGEKPCPYVVLLRVTDQRQAALMNEQWREERGCPSKTSRTLGTFESLRFAVAPGRYEVTASLHPEGQAAQLKRKTVTIETLPRNARASDLVLAREIGVVDSANSARWTLRHDGLGILTGPDVRIAAEAPKLAFYMEAYSARGEKLSGKLSGTVSNAEGAVMARMELATIESAGPRARLGGAITVAGLAPGQYNLEATVQLADTTFTRSARFAMEAPAVLAEGQNTGARYFGALTPEQLAQLFDPLVVWLDTRQQRELYTGLNETGRRQFLMRYFGADKESRLDMYLERVKRVNEKYTERTGRRTQGWQTDRGRIYLLRGEPANQLNRPFAPNDAPPYEIWSYNIGQQYVYVFIDESRLGHYRLVFTTDPGQPSLSDWENRVGPAVIEDLRAQFGIR